MTARELSAFCMEIAMLLDAAVSLDEGIYTMAADAADKEQKELLEKIAGELEIGIPFPDALITTEAFPDYVINMARVGSETGNLDIVMRSLAEYYSKESQMAQSIKSALTYPILMVFVLVLVFFVLLTKVMPIFESIYEQVGTQLSDVAKSAIHIGGIVSGAAIVIILALAGIGIFAAFMNKRGHNFSWAENLTGFVLERSAIATAMSRRRFASALSLSVKSGVDLQKGLEMAEALISQKKMKAAAEKCLQSFEETSEVGKALEVSGMFAGMEMQLIKVGIKAGRLDLTMDRLAQRYEQQADDAIDSIIGHFEPTMVAVLAVVVGLVLFSVMMPLIGIMSSIG
ncbi:MAG: type II secretion system F family protein [Clostridia bacterium]|nr:type II secretion system F family protein [Clostridia bacterium]